MTDAVKMTDHNPSHEVKDQESSDQISASNHAFDELRSLKLEMESRGSLLGKTWSELSGIMTRYQAQIIQKHEQLDNSLGGADLSRHSQMENDLKKCRTENVNLQNKVTELKLKAIEKNAELMMKDNLIEKLQSQMRQESMDYEIEIKTLKDTLEQAGCRSNDQDFISVSASLPASKRRKVSKNTTETVGDLPSRQTSSSHNAPCAGDNPLSSANPPNEQLHSTSSQRPEPSNYQPADQREMDSSYQTTDFNEPQDDGSGQEQIIIKLAEVDDDSNSGVEGSVQDTSVLSDSEGMQPGGQEQTRRNECNTRAGLQHSTPIKPLIFKCDPCDFSTENSNHFEQHMKREHGHAPRHTCDVCGKSYVYKTSLVYHQQTSHATATQVLCDACGKVYSSETAMKKHKMNVHTRSEFVQCLICNKLFYSKIHLDSHLNMHENAKPYSCDKCNKQFANAGSRNTHVKLCKQTVKPYECEECGAKFKRKSCLAVHSQKHREPSHVCDCGQKFTFRQNLSSHKKKKCKLLVSK